jgi:hypothetical protein
LHAKKKVPRAEFSSCAALLFSFYYFATLHERLAPTVWATVQEDAEVGVFGVKVATSQGQFRIERECCWAFQPQGGVFKPD